MGEIKVPELAETITEGTIAKWLKDVGDVVDIGDYLVELETDKVNVEIISDFKGTITDQKFSEGDTVKVGETIAIVDETGIAPMVENKPEAKTPPLGYQDPDSEAKKVMPGNDKSKSGGNQQRTIASPAARRLAREKGFNLHEVPTTDPLGRIRKQDVTSFQEKSTGNNPNSSFEALTKQVGNQEGSKPIIYERMSRRRQTIAKRLVEVQQTAAMLTTFNEVDMTAIMEIRKRRKDKFFDEHDVRLGFMSFFTKAVIAALKKYPYVNAEIQGDELLVKKFYDIGIAVAADEGLVVPVVRDADRKSFAEIEMTILQLADKAKTNKLSLADLQLSLIHI